MIDPGGLDLPYGSVIHATREAIVAVDPQQRIVLFNPAAERLFGHAAARVLGQPLSMLIPPARSEAHAEHVGGFDHSGLVERPMDDRLPILGLHADGREIPLAATISRTEVPGDGAPQRLLVAMLRDAGEARRLRTELALAEGRLDALVEVLPLGVWIVDEGAIVLANAPCARFFGFAQADAMRGLSIDTLVAPESHAAVRAATAAAIAQPGTIERPLVRMHHQDGSVRDVQLIVAALPSHGESTVQMVMFDLTDSVRERRSLRALAANLEQGREDERRRLARELHDVLGQQLTGLKVALAGLWSAPPPDDATALRQAEVHAQIDAAIGIVRGLARELRPPLLDTLGLRGALESLARDAARRLGIEVTTRLGSKPLAMPDATAVALYRIVQESLTNVARHARATDVDITLDLDPRELVLAVRDNGVGFPPEVTRTQGSLGLLGMRERAQAVGAGIAFDNPLGGGTRVTVRLPRSAMGAADA